MNTTTEHTEMTDRQEMSDYITTQEKRAWLARVFRDDSGEFSHKEKMEALREDNKLVESIICKKARFEINAVKSLKRLDEMLEITFKNCHAQIDKEFCRVKPVLVVIHECRNIVRNLCGDAIDVEESKELCGKKTQTD